MNKKHLIQVMAWATALIISSVVALKATMGIIYEYGLYTINNVSNPIFSFGVLISVLIVCCFMAAISEKYIINILSTEFMELKDSVKKNILKRIGTLLIFILIMIFIIFILTYIWAVSNGTMIYQTMMGNVYVIFAGILIIICGSILFILLNYLLTGTIKKIHKDTGIHKGIGIGDSMKPAFPKLSIVTIKTITNCTQKDIKVGDVVTYESKGFNRDGTPNKFKAGMVMHRVIKKTRDYTLIKGDNRDYTEKVEYTDIKGIVYKR